MKMTREQLKMIVKECLVEILNEGLGLDGRVKPEVAPRAPVAESRQRPVQPPAQRKVAFDPRLDTPIKQAVKQASNGDPIMASIFADTAKTTLQEQSAHGDNVAVPALGTASPRIEQRELFNGDPDQVFGESASRWASLAFADSPASKKER